MSARITRRAFALASACLAGAASTAETRREIGIVTAPVSLGLRPGAKGQEPGSWRAPGVLLSAGLASAVSARHRIDIARRDYEFGEQPGTRIRNGNSLRAFMLELSDAVEAELAAGRFALVLGGDCSVL